MRLKLSAAKIISLVAGVFLFGLGVVVGRYWSGPAVVMAGGDMAGTVRPVMKSEKIGVQDRYLLPIVEDDVDMLAVGEDRVLPPRKDEDRGGVGCPAFCHDVETLFCNVPIDGTCQMIPSREVCQYWINRECGQ